MENYILAKKIVNKKISNNNDLYPLFVLSIYGLLNKYKNHKNIIINLFNKTDFYIENTSIKEIIKKNNITAIDIDDDADEETGILGLSNQGYNFVIDENNNILFDGTKPFIICDKTKGNNKLLNIFIHEMSHLVKGFKNGHKTYEENNKLFYTIRSGLDYYVCEYDKETEELKEESYNQALDEAINTIETTEIIQDIKTLDGIIPDKNIQDFIDTLDKNMMDKDYGYEIIVPIVRKLWSIDHFKNLIENNIVNGTIENIVKEIDNLLGENTYENIGITIDNLYELDGQSKYKDKIKEETDYINEVIENYKNEITIKRKIKY